MSSPPALAPLFVLEGIDGSGKGTQSKRLQEQLSASGINAEVISFPQYDDTFFGKRIGDFLNGRFGELKDLNPFLVSLLYAGDRYESKEKILTAQKTCDVVILDRYVPSNIAHQAAKLDGAERQQLTEWIEEIEYGIYQIPKPLRVILLDTPIDVSQQLIADKAARTYTDQAADLQESDTTYLGRVRQAYLDLAASNTNWISIPVSNSDGLRSIDDISSNILSQVLQDLKTLGVQAS